MLDIYFLLVYRSLLTIYQLEMPNFKWWINFHDAWWLYTSSSNCIPFFNVFYDILFWLYVYILFFRSLSSLKHIFFRRQNVENCSQILKTITLKWHDRRDMAICREIIYDILYYKNNKALISGLKYTVYASRHTENIKLLAWN